MGEKEFIYTCKDTYKQVLEKYAIDLEIRNKLPLKLHFLYTEKKKHPITTCLK